jgi:membrane fusion protein (multidrug efflux system)
MNAENPGRADAKVDPAAAPEDAAKAYADAGGQSAAADEAAQKATRARRNRRRWFIILGAVILLAALAYGAYRLFFSGSYEVTDDAYVSGDVVAITSRERATAIAIYADNTEQVKAGDPLIDFDPADANAELAAAEAQLAQAVRAVRSNFSKVDVAGAQIASAEAELARARSDLSRRRSAAGEGAVSAEEVSHAADAVRTGEAALTLAKSQQSAAAAAVSGASLGNNPDVLAAVAAVRRAALVKSHMRLIAPVSGVIAQRSVQIGQQVSAGTPLMAVVPLDGVWIDANFRETQLANLRVGQPVTIKSDMYGGDVVFHGKVLGLNPGSGSAFAILPAQNASGNWIKVTQRLPVRIALDPGELRKNPLQIGLSVKVTVNTADHSGALVARSAASASARRGNGTIEDRDIDATIAQIIAQNRGAVR